MSVAVDDASEQGLANQHGQRQRRPLDQASRPQPDGLFQRHQHRRIAAHPDDLGLDAPALRPFVLVDITQLPDSRIQLPGLDQQPDNRLHLPKPHRADGLGSDLLETLEEVVHALVRGPWSVVRCLLLPLF